MESLLSMASSLMKMSKSFCCNHVFHTVWNHMDLTSLDDIELLLLFVVSGHFSCHYVTQDSASY